LLFLLFRASILKTVVVLLNVTVSIDRAPINNATTFTRGTTSNVTTSNVTTFIRVTRVNRATIVTGSILSEVSIAGAEIQN
jgi:hypothetical protein